MHTLGILLAFMLFLPSAHSADLGKPIDAVVRKQLDDWAESRQAELFKGCEKLTSREWIAKLQAADLEVRKQIKSVRSSEFRTLEGGSFFGLIATAFSYRLPDSVPMANVFNICIEDQIAFEKAKSNKSRSEAKDDWVDCLDDHPALEKQQEMLADCLEALKD